MITGRWGKPSEVLLDIVQEPGGRVAGVVNPGRLWQMSSGGVTHCRAPAGGAMRGG